MQNPANCWVTTKLEELRWSDPGTLRENQRTAIPSKPHKNRTQSRPIVRYQKTGAREMRMCGRCRSTTEDAWAPARAARRLTERHIVTTLFLSRVRIA